MFGSPQRAIRPRLTLRIFLYGVVDIFGLTCLAISAMWLANGQHVLTTSFPNNTAEAVAGIAGGLAVMLWAVAKILREMIKQGPELEQQFAARQKNPPSDR